MSNRAVIYEKPGVVSVKEVPYPTFELNTPEQRSILHGPRKCPHGAIVKPIATCICGSDMHMVRGRANASEGTQLGHEITGEVVQVGPDVEFIKTGDIVSVPFNVACGRCRNCMEMCPNLCMNVNPMQPGGAYGYVMMGGWPGGQAEYVLVPYADFNLLPIPNKSAALDNLLDLAYITDILPTGFHGALTAGVGCGDNVYIAGAGPVGLAAAACCTQLMGAGAVIVSDYEEGRLKQAKAMGCETIHLKSEWTKGVTGFVRSTLLGQDQLSESIEKILGEKYVDCAIDCTGFETNGHHGRQRHTNPERAEALNDIINTVRPGGGVGVPAVYMPLDPGAEDSFGKKGGLTLEYGTAWNKGLSIANGQCPVKRYNRRLMNAILNGRLHLAEYLNTTIISLDEAPRAYKEFDDGIARKFVIDPHNMISSRAKANAKAKTFQDPI